MHNGGEGTARRRPGPGARAGARLRQPRARPPRGGADPQHLRLRLDPLDRPRCLSASRRERPESSSSCGVDEGEHPVGVGAGVVAQRPADGLADEELPAVRRDAPAWSASSRRGWPRSPAASRSWSHRSLRADLADDRRAPYPQVVGHRPLADHGRHLVGMGEQQVAHQVGGGLVDEVPPGAGADQVLVEAERVHLPVLAVQPVTRQGEGGVPLLAEPGPVPQLQDGRLPGLLVERVRGQERPQQRPSAPGRDAAEGHRRLHVGLHRPCAGRVGCRGQRVADRVDQLGVGGSPCARLCPVLATATRSVPP